MAIKKDNNRTRRWGDITLFKETLTLPEDVTQVGDIVLRNGSSLTLPEAVTKVGNIILDHDSSLTLPEGVTQVGGLMLNQGASITFPDGYMLKNSGDNDDVLEYSAKAMNHLLSAHQKKHQQQSMKNFGIKM